MMLREAIDQYIVWQRARGASFESSAYALRRFRRSVGSAIGSDEVRADQARAFLDEGATSASNRAFLHSALRGFYRYAIARGLATHSPLPPQPPQASPRSTPYIYSHDELRRLLDATKSYRKRVNQLEPYTFRALLLLLYGAGLRRGEALRLTRPMSICAPRCSPFARPNSTRLATCPSPRSSHERCRNTPPNARRPALRKRARPRFSPTATARRWRPEPSATPSLDCARRPAWSAGTRPAINRGCTICATRSPCTD